MGAKEEAELPDGPSNKEQGHSMAKEELWALGRIVVPIVTSTFLQVLMGVVDCIIVGHLGKQQLAASALGNMWFNCLWFVCLGALSAVDTLASQAFGAKRHEEVKLVVLRGVVVASSLTVVMAIGLLNAELVMTYILQIDPAVAEMVGLYDRSLVLGLWPFALFTVLQKYLQAINEANVPVRVSAMANVFNAMAGYLLVYRTPLGFSGAPLATSLSRIFMFIYIGCHVLFGKVKGQPRNLLGVRSSKVFTSQGFRQFLGLAVPGAFMMSLEAWAFDITTLMAGLLHDTTLLSAHTSALNLSGLTFFAFPFGVGIACSIRVGNLLGAGCGDQARLSFIIAMTLACGFMVCAACGFIASANVIGYIFTHDASVVHCMAGIMPVIALYQVLDGFQGAAAGAMRGMGRQRAAAFLNFVGFWVVGIPCGYYLCFEYGLGLAGIWWGTCIGLLVLCVGQSAVLARNTDWDALAAEVSGRLRGDSSGSEGLQESLMSRQITPLMALALTPALLSSPGGRAKTQFIVDENVLDQQCSSVLVMGTYCQEDLKNVRASGDWIIGTVFVIIVALIWTAATVVKQFIFWDMHFDHPFFLSYVCNSCYMLNLGFFMIARAGGCIGSSRKQAAQDEELSPRGSPIRRAAYLGVLVAPLWFMAQWTYGSGVAATSVTSSTVISATSCAWTYVLSVLFLKEDFRWVKIFGLGFCILGNIATIAGGKRDDDSHETLTGDALCLLSALIYATYTTIIRKYVREDIPITLFFGFLGCTLFAGLSPAMWLYGGSLAAGLDWKILSFMLANGLFDNVLSQFLWAKAVLMTSPTVATVGLSLTIPLAMVSDFVRGTDLSGWSYVSAGLVITGFLFVNVGSGRDSK